ncbi:2-phospho-L-lactate guanylyltransferase, partial [Streptomyces fimicarius]
VHGPAAGDGAGSRTSAQLQAARPDLHPHRDPADLPALRTGELERVLDFASAFPSAFLRDAAGIGTTFLAAASGAEFRPAFGGPSGSRHLASGAVEIALSGVDSVRRDVDTGEDLRVALALGVGPHTARIAAVPAPAADR